MAHTEFERSTPQAKLLKRRGDIEARFLSFQVTLPPASDVARQKSSDPVSRLGLNVKQTEASPRVPSRRPSLQIAEVDARAGNFTPVAAYNAREIQQSDRGENEQHASWAIKPGDSICAVNGARNEDDMLQELRCATCTVDPHAVALSLERRMDDVFQPMPPALKVSPPVQSRPSSVGVKLPKMREPVQDAADAARPGSFLAPPLPRSRPASSENSARRGLSMLLPPSTCRSRFSSTCSSNDDAVSTASQCSRSSSKSSRSPSLQSTPERASPRLPAEPRPSGRRQRPAPLYC
eukprot:TRINITY_DN3337_c0_g1_i1.p1 TRINITY_DN3337_c0_g1~~TRINITY_DN3337_c0_g1_i1.p1  ORF type:complete len:293 (-),score=47.68 TRINITY_DN3337_c0_g1_i1:194-1072(-)